MYIHMYTCNYKCVCIYIYTHFYLMATYCGYLLRERDRERERETQREFLCHLQLLESMKLW